MVTLARTSAKRMPGMAEVLRTQSEAVVGRGAMPSRAASRAEKRNPYEGRAAGKKGRRMPLMY